MQNSMFRLEMLKEGRNIRLPILMIFYNSILAFVTILFLFFNNESMQVGYYSNYGGFLVQFLIIFISDNMSTDRYKLFLDISSIISIHLS